MSGPVILFVTLGFVLLFGGLLYLVISGERAHHRRKLELIQKKLERLNRAQRAAHDPPEDAR